MKYSLEYDHIELDVDALCFNLFGRHDLESFSAREYAAVLRLKRELTPRIAAAMGGEYYMGVSLSNTSRFDEIYYYLTGICDGVIKTSDGYCVLEIRIVNKYGRPLINDDFYRVRQSILGYCLCRQKNTDSIRLCTATYNTETGEVTTYYSDVGGDELRERYMSLISRIHRRGRFLCEVQRDRIPLLSDVIFPYRELRDSQAEMIKECYRDIKNGNRLFCQAPTGIGKTISTLYPSVKCLGERAADKIFYLTSKASIRREALSAVRKMREHGAKIYTCVLSSKEQSCICENAKLGVGKVSSYCRSDLCPYAKGYYDRAEDAIFELISGGYELDRENIRRVSQKYRICPHELSLDVSELCDIIICDYNYVFSPTVYLKRYFADSGRGEKYIFLVDEAHNLPDRARELFSAKLSNDEFEAVYDKLSDNSGLLSGIDGVLRAFEILSRLCEDNSSVDSAHTKRGYYIGRQIPKNFSEKLKSCRQACDRWLKYNMESPVYSAVDELAAKMREYTVAEDMFGDNYIIFINTRGEHTEILLYCLDPSGLLDSSLNKSCASVLFSATLTPTEYFADILGGGRRSVSVSFPSPFPHENLCVAAVDSISTRYEDREKTYSKIASCIAATASAKAGNYIVFLPSYGYMEQVAKKFCEKYPKVRTRVQRKGMSYRDREEFLSFFEDDNKLRVGFCVMGGVFSEGIDLPGDRLIGVVIVGVGLPGISNERNIMRDYYEEKSGNGYDYAYTYPGMNCVLQAIGRVIRREQDRGIAVLIDDRYAEPKYRDMLLQEWKNIKYARNSASLAEIAHDFWNKRE